MSEPQLDPQSLIRARRNSLRHDRALNGGIAPPRPVLTRNTQPYDPNTTPRPLKTRLHDAKDNPLMQAKLLIEAAKSPFQHKRDELKQIGKIDLSGVDLTSLKDDLRFLPFGHVNLAGANMDGGNFRGADMRGIEATGASFKGADLADAKMGGAHMNGAQFQGAILAGASFQAARAAGSDFTGSNADGASFSGANLAGSSLAGANFQNTNLDNASVTGVKARDTNFSGSFGENTQFSGEFQDAKFIGSRFTASSFGGGDYKGADFSNATLTNPKGSLDFLRDVAPAKRPTVENTQGLAAATAQPKVPLSPLYGRQWAGMSQIGAPSPMPT